MAKMRIILIVSIYTSFTGEPRFNGSGFTLLKGVLKRAPQEGTENSMFTVA